MLAKAPCLSLLALVGLAALLVPNRVHAQGQGPGYGLGPLFAYERNSPTEIDTVPADGLFDLRFDLFVGGSTISPQTYPEGTLTFTLNGAVFEGLTEDPMVPLLHNLQCTPGASLVCSFGDSTGTGFTIGIGLILRAPQVAQDTPMTISATVDPYDDELGNIGVPDMQETTLTVQAGAGAEADLSLACQHVDAGKQDEIPVGEEATVACTLVNNGTAEAEDITLTATFDGVPVDSTTSSSDSPGVTCEEVVCTVPSLPPGDHLDAMYRFTPRSAGSLTATVAATTSTPETNLADNDFQFTFDVRYEDIPLADLSLTMTADPRFMPEFRDEIVYTLGVENSGPDAATNIVVQDSVENFLEYLVNDCGATFVAEEGVRGSLVWEIGSLGAGETVFCTYRTLFIFDDRDFWSVVPPEGFSNTAEIIESDQPDPDSTPGNGEPTEDDYARATVRPSLFPYFDEGPSVNEGMIFFYPVRIINIVEEDLDYTVTFSADGTVLDLGLVISPPDAFCAPPDEAGEVVCEGVVSPDDPAVLDIVLEAIAEGSGEVCAEVNGFPPLCASAEVRPTIPLPDLSISAFPINDAGGFSDYYVIQGEPYAIEVDVSNNVFPVSNASQTLLRFDVPRADVVVPPPCVIESAEGALPTVVRCDNGPLGPGQNRSFVFETTSSDLRLHEHVASIIPIDPPLDLDGRNHRSEVPMQVIEAGKEIKVQTSKPRKVSVGEKFTTQARVTDRSDGPPLDYRWLLSLPRDMAISEILCNGCEFEFEINDTTATVSAMPDDDLYDVFVTAQFDAPGSHDIGIEITVDGVTVYTETFTIEAVDTPPTLTVTKEASTLTPRVPTPFTYTITVTSEQDTEVSLYDLLPPNVDIYRPSGALSPAPDGCTYIRSPLPPAVVVGCTLDVTAKEPYVFTFDVVPLFGGRALNRVIANDATDRAIVEAQALVVETPNLIANVGHVLFPTATVTNNGTEPALDTQVTFFESPGFIFFSFATCTAISSGDLLSPLREIRCDLGTLAPGESRRVSVGMELRAAQNVMLPVSATSSDGRFDIASFAINVGTRQAGVAVADARSGDGGNKHAEAVDVYLDGVRIADDLAPGAATAFLPVTLISTTPRIDLVDAAAPDNSAPLASFTADLFGPSADTLAFSEQTMLLLADTPGDTLGLVVKHHARTEAEDATEADVFFVHASPDAPRLLARLRSVQEALPPLAFGETSAYQPVKPGVYLVDVSDADTGTLLDTFRLDLTASAGQAVALVLTGRRADGTFTLDAFDAAGADVPSPVEEAALPLHFTLHGNYPNPFNPTTTIRFDLPEPALVHVEVFDVLGRRVLVLPSQPTLAGAAQERALDAAALASGLYFYRVTATASTRTYQQTGRMMLLK